MVNRMDGMAGDLGVKVYLHGQHSYMGYFKLLLKATLHSQLPADFCVPVEEFYTNAFHAFHTKQQVRQASLLFAKINHVHIQAFFWTIFRQMYWLKIFLIFFKKMPEF